MKNFFKTLWSVICYPLLYLAVQAVVSVVYIVYIFIRYISEIDLLTASPEEIVSVLLNHLDIYLLTLISVFLALAIIFLIQRKSWAQSRFWRVGGLRVLPLLGCVVLGGVFNAFMCGALELLSRAGVDFSAYSDMMSLIIGNNLILEIIAIGIAAPLIEEIIFRGIVFNRLRAKMNAPLALILQALVFGIIHLNLVQGAYAFLIGLVIGLVYLWLDSIWAVFIMHSVFNLTSVVVFGRIEAISLSATIIMMAVSLAICALGLYWFYRRRSHQNEKLAQD